MNKVILQNVIDWNIAARIRATAENRPDDVKRHRANCEALIKQL